MKKEKLVKCKVCEADIAASAKACPHCGAPSKKPFYKKAWFWIVLVIVLAMSSGGEEQTSNGSTVDQKPAETVATVETTMAIETQPATEAPTLAAETMPADEEIREQVSVETVVSLIKSVNEFKNCEYDYDETGITLNIWEDGIAMGASLASSGAAEYVTLWNNMVNNMEYFSDSLVEFAKTCGREDLLITVNLLNDQNHDNVLLMIINGVIVYDSVSDA